MNTADRNGSCGGMYLTSSSGAQTDTLFACVEILEDATTFDVLTNDVIKGDSLASRTWKRGDRIWGLTTAITLTAGEVLCWNKV